MGDRNSVGRSGPRHWPSSAGTTETTTATTATAAAAAAVATAAKRQREGTDRDERKRAERESRRESREREQKERAEKESRENRYLAAALLAQHSSDLLQLRSNRINRRQAPRQALPAIRWQMNVRSCRWIPARKRTPTTRGGTGQRRGVACCRRKNCSQRRLRVEGSLRREQHRPSPAMILCQARPATHLRPGTAGQPCTARGNHLMPGSASFKPRSTKSTTLRASQALPAASCSSARVGQKSFGSTSLGPETKAWTEWTARSTHRRQLGRTGSSSK